MKPNIRLKLLLHSLFIVLLVGGSVSLYTIHQGRRQVLEGFQEDAVDTAAMISRHIAGDLYFLNIGGLRQRLENTTLNPDYSFVYAMDANGIVLSDGTRQNNRRDQQLKDPFSKEMMLATQWISRMEDNLLKVGGPIITADDTRIGYLQMGFSLKNAHAIIRRTTQTNLLITVLCLAIGSCLALVLSRNFTRPILDIAGAAMEIGAGKLATRLQIKRGDELGLLAESINGMAISLEKNIERVQALYEINLTTTSTLIMQNVIEILLTKGSQLLPTSALSVTLWNDETKIADPVACINLDQEKWRVCWREMAPSLMRELMGDGTVMVIEDSRTDSRTADSRFFVKYGLTSFLGLALTANGAKIGMLSFHLREGHSVSGDEIKFLSAFASQAAMAIYNAQLYQAVHDQKAAIEKAKEIEAAAAAKSRFLAMMSHEIRTPLNAVIGLTEIMLQSDLTEDQRRMTETISQSGSGLLQIINDILDFSKIEADKITVELVDFNLAEVVTGAVNIMSAQAKAKGLTLTMDIASDVPQVVTGDGGRIRQILLNLIGNAVKFTAEGVVKVSVAVVEQNRDGMRIKFSVSDHGIGISSAAQARLFQPFSQADTSTTRKFGGTGLGLAISKRLAELMGGSMNVESEEGKGSTFWFTAFTPRVEQPAAPIAPAHRQETKYPSMPLPDRMKESRILLVEDNPVNQMVALRLLEMIGLSADVACDGAEALEAVERQAYDLLLMDCEMPNMDGYEATAQIRRREADTGARTRIVAMTANAMSGDREKCLGAGMDDYVAKPIQLDTLQAALERCL